MPDPIFSDPRLARIYDPLDPDRGDLDAYVGMVEEFGARSVLDVGCGTGVLACRLAGLGLQVIGVDPAAASVDVARTKPGAADVHWVVGDAPSLAAGAADLVPPGAVPVDLAVMTGNVAQVFVDDADWAATLTAVHALVRPGGRFVFETRDPSREAWRAWHEEAPTTDHVEGVGTVEHRSEILAADGDTVTFRWTFRFVERGDVLVSDSTLRFRSREAVERSLADAGFDVVDVRDAPDRPGLEFVFVTVRR